MKHEVEMDFIRSQKSPAETLHKLLKDWYGECKESIDIQQKLMVYEAEEEYIEMAEDQLSEIDTIMFLCEELMDAGYSLTSRREEKDTPKVRLVQ